MKFGFNLTATEMSPSPAAKRHTKKEEETDLPLKSNNTTLKGG